MMTVDMLVPAAEALLSPFIWALGASTVFLFSLATYRLLLHPLARVPGPKLAAISNIWLARHVRDGQMLTLGKTLHRVYGSAVRVGPNEVWFDSAEAFRAIYGRSSASLPRGIRRWTQL